MVSLAEAYVQLEVEDKKLKTGMAGADATFDKTVKKAEESVEKIKAATGGIGTAMEKAAKETVKATDQAAEAMAASGEATAGAAATTDQAMGEVVKSLKLGTDAFKVYKDVSVTSIGGFVRTLLTLPSTGLAGFSEIGTALKSILGSLNGFAGPAVIVTGVVAGVSALVDVFRSLASDIDGIGEKFKKRSEEMKRGLEEIGELRDKISAKQEKQQKKQDAGEVANREFGQEARKREEARAERLEKEIKIQEGLVKKLRTPTKADWKKDLEQANAELGDNPIVNNAEARRRRAINNRQSAIDQAEFTLMNMREQLKEAQPFRDAARDQALQENARLGDEHMRGVEFAKEIEAKEAARKAGEEVTKEFIEGTKQAARNQATREAETFERGRGAINAIDDQIAAENKAIKEAQKGAPSIMGAQELGKSMQMGILRGQNNEHKENIRKLDELKTALITNLDKNNDALLRAIEKWDQRGRWM